jgi:hypothetical protein
LDAATYTAEGGSDMKRIVQVLTSALGIFFIEALLTYFVAPMNTNRMTVALQFVLSIALALWLYKAKEE